MAVFDLPAPYNVPGHKCHNYGSDCTAYYNSSGFRLWVNQAPYKHVDWISKNSQSGDCGDWVNNNFFQTKELKMTEVDEFDGIINADLDKLQRELEGLD